MWFLLSIANAFFESLADLSGKLHTQRLHVLVSAWSIRLAVLILLLPIWYIFDGPVKTDLCFWAYAVSSALINTVTSVLYMRALKHSDLSLCIPLLKLSPIWTIFTAQIINGDSISFVTTLGVLIMVSGTYFLNLSLSSEGLLKPFTILWSDTGMRSMLFVSLLWSISAPFDKEAIRHSSPMFYLVVLNFLLVFFLSFPVGTRWSDTRHSMNSLRYFSNLKALFFRAFAGMMSTILQMYAFTLASVVVVTSIKRTSSLWGVLWGRLFFGEDKVRERFTGAVITFIGMLFVVLG